MELSTVARGAQVIALPTAATEPVVNPRRSGRLPHGSNVIPKSAMQVRWVRQKEAEKKERRRTLQAKAQAKTIEGRWVMLKHFRDVLSPAEYQDLRDETLHLEGALAMANVDLREAH